MPALRAGAYEAIAICFLNAFVNPAHERSPARAVGEGLPDLLVTISSDITREFREYERASTTTLSAYVQPVIERYIDRFRTRLDHAGFRGHFSVMQSNGGRLPARRCAPTPSTLCFRGLPRVSWAPYVRSAVGLRDVVTLDIGGTSTDVCVVRGGVPQLTQEFQLDGLPIRIPLLDINTVGAGGGSIIWVDEGGMLRVGPHSAGASRARPATAVAGPSPRSPMRMSCAGRFGPRHSSAETCRSTPRRQRAPCSPSPSASA